MTQKPQKPGNGSITRRRFVTLVAAGSAALFAGPAAAAAPRPRTRRAAAAPAAVAPKLSAASEKELARQRTSTVDTLKVIRNHPMPAGTELALVFRARVPAAKKGR